MTTRAPEDPDSFPLAPRRFEIDGVVCTLEDFFDANPDLDVGDLHDLACLAVGESVTWGGGEFLSITVRRIG